MLAEDEFGNEMEVETLGDALPKEIARVRDIIRVYDATPHGYMAAALMQRGVETAEMAMMAQDVGAMLIAYKDLKGWEL